MELGILIALFVRQNLFYVSKVMRIDYQKRQRYARLVAVTAWMGLVIYLQPWSCAESPGMSAGQEVNTGLETGSILSSIAPLTVPRTEYIMLLGFDSVGSLPGRTDTIMIVAARYATREVGVLSVPRDLWVDIPGAKPGRINTVYRIGNRLHGKGGGRRLMRKIIEHEFGLRIDYTAEVDFSGFAYMVDLLGGIDVDVSCPIRDNFVSRSTKTGYESFFVNAGRHRMNGRAALGFCRSRHGRGDLDRTVRQQAVLLGFKRRAMDLDILPKLPGLFSAVKRYVATDIDLTGAIRLANLALVNDHRMIHGMVLQPPVVKSWRSKDGKNVLRLDRKRVKAALDSLYSKPLPGTRKKAVCKTVDAALNWKDRVEANRPLSNNHPTEKGRPLVR